MINKLISKFEQIKEITGRPEGVNVNSFPVFSEFFSSLSIFYLSNYTFRCVFDTYFRSGVINSPLPDNITNKKLYGVDEETLIELKLCHALVYISQELAKKYCVTFREKKRSYEMLSLLLFNHYFGIEGMNFCDLGGCSSPLIILNLFNAATHTVIESPDYVIEHGDLFSRHNIDDQSHQLKGKLHVIKKNLEDISRKDLTGNFDRVFSINCFEHIMEIENGLRNLYTLSNDSSYVYSTFAPIYSYLENGDHGSVKKELRHKFPGIHLYPDSEKWAALRHTFPSLTESQLMNEMSDILYNQSALINKLKYEDFRRIFLESDYGIVACQEINSSLFWSSPESKKAYKDLPNQPTAFPDCYGMHVILKKGIGRIYDSLLSGGVIRNLSM